MQNARLKYKKRAQQHYHYDR